VLLAYIFGGISIHLNAGIFIEKKTAYLFPTSVLAAVSNIVANYFLIPIYGIMGAAYATLIAYALGAISLFVIVQRFYPIHYEYGRALKIAGSLALVCLIEYGAAQHGMDSLMLRIGALVLWPIILLLLRFFDENELSRIVGLFRAGNRSSE